MVSPVTYYSKAEDIFYNYNNLEHVIILCDSNTRHLCFPKLKLLQHIPVIEVNAGEDSKSIDNLAFVWNQLLQLKANRSNILVNLGGGVISDLGGMAAATFHRGMRCINIPTTLMGMVDAAHGGKTGINLQQYKNYLGTFSMPEAIWICPDFLETLPSEEITSGFAEMLKHGLIDNPEYFEQLITADVQNVLKNVDLAMGLIETSVAIKMRFVNQDPYDKSVRQVLNFGHTIGHGFESFFMDNPISHGQCVAAGMLCEAYISWQKKLLSSTDFEKIKSAIDKHFKRLIYSKNTVEAIIDIIMKDKKNDQKGIRCVLLNGIGKAEFAQSIHRKDAENALEYYITNS